MSKSKPSVDPVESSTDEVEILVRPDNIALIRPPAEQLGPLLEYQRFFLGDADLAPAHPAEEAADAPELSPCTAFPAGLLSRFAAALTAGGYDGTYDDLRRSAPGLKTNKELCRDREGEERAFLRAVIKEPLGLIYWGTWYDVHWRIGNLCALYPDARILIVVQSNWGAAELHTELGGYCGKSLGLLAHVEIGEGRRCLITTFRWLARLTPGRWPILVPIVLRSSTLTEAAYQAVVRQRARRVYTFVPHGIRLGKLTGLRLEAMSGDVIDASPAPP